MDVLCTVFFVTYKPQCRYTHATMCHLQVICNKETQEARETQKQAHLSTALLFVAELHAIREGAAKRGSPRVVPAGDSDGHAVPIT